MEYPEYLEDTTRRTGSIICMGMDPLLELIPEEGPTGDRIFRFYETILSEIRKRGHYPGAVKPNYAFYAQYGLEGIETLRRLCDLYRSENIPVILDAKRGDIGKTARAYAMESFDFFNADAVTLSPYMGFDSIEPYMEMFPEKGYYLLTRTSNPGASEVQNIDSGGKPLYLRIAERIVSWYRPGLGSVVGATAPSELSDIIDCFSNASLRVPLLIPGVGSQGGDLTTVLTILSNHGTTSLHRINSSSGINYAYRQHAGMHYAEAAVTALAELNETTADYVS
jgi:orotidine-5'-phosphate decarboxylase